MGKVLLVVGVILAIAILGALVVFYTRRWRDRQILKRDPLALQAKGLNRDALLALADQKKENAHLYQTLGNIAELLTSALGDDIVTVWDPATKQIIKRALAAAQEPTKKLEK